MSLTDKHQRFVDEYLVDLNGAQAAVRAGYSKLRAPQTASELLRRDDVQAAISERQAKLSEAAGVNAKGIIDELAKLGFANMLDYIEIGPDGFPVTDFSALTREQAAAIQEIIVETREIGSEDGPAALNRKVRFKLHDKRGPLVDLGKHLGLFKQQVEHTGKDGGPIEVQHSVRDLAKALLTALDGE